MFKSLRWAFVLPSLAALAGAEFRPGEVWLDTSGTPIQAHGGGILARSNTWYWYGEDRTPGRRPSVSCYASTNLYDWRHAGVVLTNGAVPAAVIERPKVIFNPRTGKYVMWMHLEQRRGYQYARAGIATSDRPEGPFLFLHAIRPITNDFGYKDDDPDRQKEFGGTYRDMNLFVDDDGTGLRLLRLGGQLDPVCRAAQRRFHRPGNAGSGEQNLGPHPCPEDARGAGAVQMAGALLPDHLGLHGLEAERGGLRGGGEPPRPLGIERKSLPRPAGEDHV
jgi:hypothetical protein